jgi:hypothetical protein
VQFAPFSATKIRPVRETVGGRARQFSHIRSDAQKPDEEAKAALQPGFSAIHTKYGTFAAAMGIYLPHQTD